MSAKDITPIGASPRLEGFDGLRAIAVLAVASYHFFQTVAVFPTGAVTAFDIGGQFRVGVWIFFVLSGFLLYRPYARTHAADAGSPSLARYARARLLRIWPAYAMAIVVLAFVWHRIQVTGRTGAVAQLSLTQNYFPSQFQTGLGPAWSLVVEVGFYAFLPVYAWVIARGVRSRNAWSVELFGVTALVIVGFAWQLATVGHPQWATMLPGFLPTFAIGMAFAIAVAHQRDFGLSWLAGRPWLCWSAAAVFVLGKGIIGGFDFFELGFEFQNQIVYSAIAFLVVLPAVFGDRSRRGNRVLHSSPLRLLGVISYGVFLWSVPVMQVVQREWVPLEPPFWGRSAVVALISLAVTVAIATISWLLVERPALALKHVSPTRRRRPTADASTAGERSLRSRR